MSELIVMRLVDMYKRHPKQINDRVCSRCGAAVGIYPSGQEALAKDPELQIVCFYCINFKEINKEMENGEEIIFQPAAINQEALYQEMFDSYQAAPNKHKVSFKRFHKLMEALRRRRRR